MNEFSEASTDELNQIEGGGSILLGVLRGIFTAGTSHGSNVSVEVIGIGCTVNVTVK
jgi:hypothetical protein